MPEIQHLNKAPIVEGLIDFRVRPKKAIDLSSIENNLASLKARYPKTKQIRRLVAQLSVKDQGAPSQSVSDSRVGLRLESANGLGVIQAGFDGVSISRLRPYDTWEALITEARTVWKEYVAATEPEAIVRVATRFINRIEIPMPLREFKDYFTVPPDVPPGMPEFVSEFLSRVVLHDPTGTDAVIVFTQAMEPLNSATNTVPFYLDIDVFKGGEFATNDELPWELLSKFRVLKNKAFFASITDRTLEFLK